MTIPLQAVQHIRRMRGGAQAHLMRTADGFFVTKFRNNPQGVRILANEFFASRLGLWLGLPVSEIQVIEVSDWLIEHTPELHIEIVDAQIPCASGLHVGARYACDPLEGWATDYLPESQFGKVKAVSSFARILVLDKWAGNTDGRQAVFSKNARQRKFGITFIDQAFCFNAEAWDFPDLPLHGVYYRNFVYAGVTGWDSFEPTLSKAEEADIIDIWRCAEQIPPEWYKHETGALEQLVETLYGRRSKIRDLIRTFRESSRNPFPNWKHSSACSAAAPCTLSFA